MPWALLLAGFLQAPLPRAWERPMPGAPSLACAHQGVFRKFNADYLQVAFYVDPVGLRRCPAAQDLRAWILKGNTWCGRRSRVLQEIGRAKRLEGFQAQLAAHWEGRFDASRPSVKALLASASHPLEVGDLIEYVWAPDGRVAIRYGHGPWQTFEDRKLHQALLRIAFGNDADPEMAALDRGLAVLMK